MAKSKAASKVLQLMDSSEDANYCQSLKTGLAKYPAINRKKLEMELKSFQWNNGFHIVIAFDDELIRLCRLDEDMQPQKYDDGRYMCSVTGVNNKGILPTNLTYKLEANFTYL